MIASFATILALLPRSDEALAKDIGISSKTIKRIKSGSKPSKAIAKLIVDYLKDLYINIECFIIKQP